MVLSLDSLFSRFPLNKVIVETYEFAETLRHMLERMGFEECGVYPEHYWRDGRSWSLRIMQMRRERWDRQRSRYLSLLDTEQFLAEYSTDGVRPDEHIELEATT